MTVQSIAQALYDAAAAMAASNDERRAKQVQELSSKLTEGRLTVALCGHFSAGKSTLINTICGAKLLPSSPIPTSANVVSIQGGDQAIARVETMKDGQRTKAEVAIDQLEQYCVDGETFTHVSIHYPSEVLGEHITLLDTPGIDSTDDAHRLATESALHLADVVFYVMDYNHVQSEINFAFAKQLKDWGKPLYFVVNQIDKHREKEISFESYCQSVEDAFHAWHLEPEGIIYLSLRKPEHPYHQWDALLKLLQELEVQRQTLCSYSVEASLHHVMQEHIKWLEQQEEEQRASLLEQAGGPEAAAQAKLELERIKASKDSLEAGPDVMSKELRQQLQSLLDNANITPAALRDLAQLFLESQKPGFKSGFLFAGNKTAAEKEKRLSQFRSELHSLISAAIEWHLKQLLRQAAEQAGYESDQLESQLQAAISWLPDDDWLLRRIHTGAVFGNEYTMTFCKDLAADIKSIYRKNAIELIDMIVVQFAAQNENKLSAVREQLAQLGTQAAAVVKLEELDQLSDAREQELKGMLPDRSSKPALPKPARFEAKAQTYKATADNGQASSRQEASLADAVSAAKTSSDAAAAAKDAAGAFASGNALGKQRDAGYKLQRAADLLQGHAALEQAAAALRDKADRLQSSSFTIALFGAFSAGKSSLANALIGEPVLPVSPNPTTASINRLLPPTKQYPHRTARIVMKSEEELLDDLLYSLALLGEEANKHAYTNIESILAAADRLTPDKIGASGRAHYSFLRAASNGWAEHKDDLGQELKVDHEQYERFVAEESRSCFVRSIDFHYNCPLTAEGIVLVDTPGADSVNARHTGVAFNYIKNADAVLFVTYYNHAFSQADRQFLQQLGRVKDQFELDKMFFIVNAADLAADKEELEGVLKHVEANLLQHEIRFPRLFPVSSLQALDGKLAGDSMLLENSGLPLFEQAFLSFVQQDLGALAIETAEQELERIKATVSGWLTSARGAAADRAAELERLAAASKGAMQSLSLLGEQSAPEQLKQDISELHYYVLQRIQFRFGEFYNYSFNPAVLQDDGRDMKKMLLTAWLELERQLQRELEQELQATSLRVERNLHKQQGKLYADMAESLEQQVLAYKAPKYEGAGLEAPALLNSFKAQEIDVKWLWGKFKSPRYFFEGEGKGLLRAELEKLLLPGLQGWMSEHTLSWTSYYEQCWRQSTKEEQLKLEKDLQAHIKGMSDSLQNHSKVEEWRALHDQLIHL